MSLILWTRNCLKSKTKTLLSNSSHQYQISPWGGFHSGTAAPPPPSLWPWCLETRCPLWDRRLYGSRPPEPSSTESRPWCCVYSAPGWSERRSQSRLGGGEWKKISPLLHKHLFIIKKNWLSAFIYRLEQKNQIQSLPPWSKWETTTTILTVVQS